MSEAFELQSPRDSGFAGREFELAELTHALGDAFAGHGTLYAVVGEPGVGKSRLAREFALLGRERGARTLWASAWRHPRTVAPPCSLWARLLRDAARAEAPCGAWNTTTAEPTLSSAGGTEGREVLAGGAMDLLALRDAAAPALGLLEATLERLAGLARTQPLLIVVDDLHAADLLSLLALEFIASHLPGIPMVIVAIYRGAEMCRVEAGVEFPCSTGFRNGRMLSLRGLSEAELTGMIEQRTGRTPDGTDVERVTRLTRGNPRFVELLLRDCGLARAGKGEVVEPLPPAVAAAAEQHLVALSESAREILAAAAVIGRDFDLAALKALTDCTPTGLLDALAEAQGVGVLERHGDASGRYRFAHPLVWRALYDSLAGSRRALLHYEAGRFIEKAFGYDRTRLGDLARHFHEGVLTGGAEKAIDYCRGAGDYAMENLRFKTAARFYAMALAAANLGAPDETRRCDLLLKTAEAHTAAGDLAEAAESFRQAAELAGAREDAGRFALAALGRAGSPVFASAAPDWEIVSLLTRALGMVGDRDAVLRVRLLLRLSAELCCQEGASARRREFEREAELIAGRAGNAEAQFVILLHHHLFVHCAPESVGEQLVGTTEMLRVALRRGRPEDCITALLYRYGSMLRKGEAALPPPELALVSTAEPVLEGRALETGYRYYAAVLALLEGRFREGASLVMRFLGVAHAVGRGESGDTLWPALLLPFRELGRLAEVEALAAQAIDRHPGVPLFRTLAMEIHWLLGKREQARDEFGQLAVRDFEDLHKDIGFLVCLSALAEVCAGLKDRRRAAALYRLLEPHAAMNAVFGPLVFFGPVSFYLGTLADVMQNFELAQRHFEAALGACGRLKARAWEAYVRHGWARMLGRRGDAASREKACELAAGALVTAEELGMADLAARLAELKDPAAQGLGASSACELRTVEAARSAQAMSDRVKVGFNDRRAARAAIGENAAEQVCDTSAHGMPKPPLDNDALASVDECMFVREGDFWTLAFEGRVVRLKHTRGLAFMAHLLEFPGREFYVADLVATADGFNAAGIEANAKRPRSGDLRTVPPGHDDSGPILDARARAAYKGCLEELRCELEEARSFSDPGRAAKIEEEISFITRELARAAGLGVARRFGSPSERARINVTNAVRSVLQKLRQHHPALGRYLATTIRTGSRCSYQPDPRFRRAWRVSRGT